MKLSIRVVPSVVLLGIILIGLLVGFTTEQEIVDETRADPDALNWNIAVLDTARNAAYLTGVEKDVILEMNKARTNPKKYAELYIQPRVQYFRGKRYAEPGLPFISTVEGAAVVAECAAEMANMYPVGILLPERGLALAARDHALDQGRTGATGHTGSDDSDPFDRIERYGDSLTIAGENLAYGSSTGRAIVLQLLIDDGIFDRSHRSNVMRSDFAQAGIAIAAHPQFRAMCAISYARDYRTNQNALAVRR